MHPEMAAALSRGALVLTANRRLARSLRLEYDSLQQSAGRAAWPAPNILPLGAWLRAQWNHALYSNTEGLPLLLNEWQEHALWRLAIEPSPEAAQILQLDAAADTAREAWALMHQWRLPQSRAQYAVADDPAAFWTWARDYHARCQSLGATDAARLPDLIRDLFHRALLPIPSQIWLAGFDEFTPQQEALWKELEKAGVPLVHSQNLELPAAGATLTPFPDSPSEIYAAARWARSTLQHNPAARVGIVIPQLNALRNLVERAFDEIVPNASHISIGPPLAQRPPVHAALLILETFTDTVPAATATALLLTPYRTAAAELRGARARADAEFRRFPTLQSPIANLDGIEPAPVPAEAPPSQWARTFAQRLDDFGWPGATLSSVDYQTVDAFRRLLSQMATLDLVTPSLSLHRAFTWLRRAAAQLPFQIEDPGMPIQILGILEAAGAEFDALWIAGMHEEAWPEAPAPNPFLPLPLQRDRRVPHATAARELEFAAQATRRLLASAADITVSYTTAEGEKTLGPSPLLAHLPARTPPEPQRPWYLHPAPIETILDESAPPLPIGAAVGGGARLLSDQAACPFRAFAAHRLHARELDEATLGFDYRERGTLMHRALQYCWEQIVSLDNLRTLAEPDLNAILARSAQQALRTPRDRFSERLTAIEQKRLEQMLRRWLEVEKLRTIDFRVIAEKKRDVDIGGLRLTTRADRVDQLPDAACVLIDYKSTAPNPAAWDGDRPDEPQLPLYAITANQPVAAVAFANMRAGKLRFRGHAVAEGILPEVKAEQNLPAIVAQWRTVLERLAANHRQGRAEVDPKKHDTCKFCGLQALCRILETQ